MRSSQGELLALTGRLLQAQETERRRIARELHDDLNQALALIAVELDLLTLGPPGTGSTADGRVRELSGRVKQLSSAVHDLSHQLHPAKLEQLGLVAALRGLCDEFGRAHGLGVDFTAEGVSSSTPGETSLCLYRIAQEALRNVIKHSGALHARVELRGSPDALSLTDLRRRVRIRPRRPGRERRARPGQYAGAAPASRGGDHDRLPTRPRRVDRRPHPAEAIPPAGSGKPFRTPNHRWYYGFLMPQRPGGTHAATACHVGGRPPAGS